MTVKSEELIIAVEKPSAWGRELTITVPANQVDRERSATVSRLAGRVRLPGFRKGKVPAGVIQKRYGAAIEQELLERVIGDAYREAVKREGLQPITQANVDRVDYQAGSDLTFKVALEVRPVIELERIGGFTMKREVAPVTADQIDGVLDRLRDQQAAWRPIEEGGLQNGDMAMVEISEREADGSTGKPRSYRLVLGEDQALPAVEAVILTLKPGESGDFTVDLPENSDEANGPTRAHEINVRVIEAARPEKPELDDEFAKSLGADFESLDALRTKVTEDLSAEAEREADRAVRGALLQQIIEANPFEVPDSMIDDYVKRIVPDRDAGDAEKIEEIRRSARMPAAGAIRRMLVIERVAETESLHATPDELTAKLDDIAQRTGRPAPQLRAQLSKDGRLDELENEITERKVFEYLLTLSTTE